MARKIFINYRHDENVDVVGRICDRLEQMFSKSSVFRDSNALVPGQTWPEELQKALNNSDVLLAIIGPRWLELSNQHRRKIDYVHEEIREALANEIAVIPVTIKGAKLPSADVLPPEIRPLTERQAQPIGPDDRHFDKDVEKLTRAIKGARKRKRNARLKVAIPLFLGALAIFSISSGAAAWLIHPDFRDALLDLSQVFNSAQSVSFAITTSSTPATPAIYYNETGRSVETCNNNYSASLMLTARNGSIKLLPNGEAANWLYVTCWAADQANGYSQPLYEDCVKYQSAEHATIKKYEPQINNDREEGVTRIGLRSLGIHFFSTDLARKQCDVWRDFGQGREVLPADVSDQISIVQNGNNLIFLIATLIAALICWILIYLCLAVLTPRPQCRLEGASSG